MGVKYEGHVECSINMGPNVNTGVRCRQSIKGGPKATLEHYLSSTCTQFIILGKMWELWEATVVTAAVDEVDSMHDDWLLFPFSKPRQSQKVVRPVGNHFSCTHPQLSTKCVG